MRCEVLVGEFGTLPINLRGLAIKFTRDHVHHVPTSQRDSEWKGFVLAARPAPYYDTARTKTL